MLRRDRTALGEQFKEFADDFRVLDGSRDGDVRFARRRAAFGLVEVIALLRA